MAFLSFLFGFAQSFCKYCWYSVVSSSFIMFIELFLLFGLDIGDFICFCFLVRLRSLVFRNNSCFVLSSSCFVPSSSFVVFVKVVSIVVIRSASCCSALPSGPANFSRAIVRNGVSWVSSLWISQLHTAVVRRSK